MTKTPACKRFLIALPLSLLAGLLCAYLASLTNPAAWQISHPLFWTIVTDRLLIGLTVGLAGPFTTHPVFGFRCWPPLRGAVLGAFASLPLAFGGIIDATTLPPEITTTFIFWATVGAGAVYGLLIDVIATRWGGEGRALLPA